MTGAAADVGAQLVSCLMVTRGALVPARFAIDCFRAQTHANRELVIVCDRPADALQAHLDSLADPAIRLVATRPAPLGELRNVAVDAGAGDLVCQWDDDDLYAPERLAAQVAALGRFDAVFLKRWMLWWPARQRLAISGRRVWEGSMLARKQCVPRYPARSTGEDTVAIQQMGKTHRLGLLDRPSLYCYVHHGTNTTDSRHFERIYVNASRRFEFAAYEPSLARLAALMPIDGYRAAICPDD